MAEHRETDPAALTPPAASGRPGANGRQPLEVTSGNPGPDEQVCFNCEYRAWGVALGIGVLCRHPANERDRRPLRIPSRRHTCGHFAGGPGYVDPPAVVVRRPDDA